MGKKNLWSKLLSVIGVFVYSAVSYLQWRDQISDGGFDSNKVVTNKIEYLGHYLFYQSFYVFILAFVIYFWFLSFQKVKDMVFIHFAVLTIVLIMAYYCLF